MPRLLSSLLIAAIGMALLTPQTQAETLTLDDCIEIALQNRLSIIRARNEETLSKWDERWALGQFLPGARLSYNYSKGKETDIDPANFDPIDSVFVTEQDIGPNKSLTFSADMWVFNVPTWFNYFGARQDKMRAHLDVIDSEQDLILSVKTAYYAYLAAVENVEVQEQAVERSTEQLKLIESQFELGSASKSDVLRQRVLLGNDQLALLEAENAVVTTKATMAFTIGLDPHGENIEFATEYSTRDYDGTLEQAIGFGMEHEPGLLSAEKSVAASSHAVRSRWADYLPTLSVFYDYTIFEGTQAFPTVFDYSFNRRNYGFRISFNIFDGFARERSLVTAKVNSNNAKAGLTETRNLMVRDIKSAYYEITQQREAKRVADENVESATEDLKITQEKYRLGAATILDLLNSQVTLKQTQVALIRADFDLNLAIARLENAMGKM